MSQLLTLQDFVHSCEHCHEKRYILRAKGDVSVGNICQHCFHTCPACKGEEFVYITDKNGYQYVKECSLCGALKARVQLFNEAEIPARYHSLQNTLEEFQTHRRIGDGSGKQEALGNLFPVKSKLYKWLQSFVPGDRGFLLHGDVGTGKTHLLSAIVRHLTLEKGIAARFVEFSHLLSNIREQFEQGRGGANIIGPLADVPVLAIDELGKGRSNNEWQLSIIDEIISKRYNRNLTTLFTTNYPVESPAIHGDTTNSRALRHTILREGLSDRIGDRIYSRLYEMAEFIQIDAPDYRKAGRP